MKNLLCACAFSFAATSVYAGGYSDPIVEPEIVIEEAVKSAGNDEWVVALLTFVAFGLAIAK